MKVKELFIGKNGRLGAKVQISVSYIDSQDAANIICGNARIKPDSINGDEIVIYIPQQEYEHEALASTLEILAASEKALNERLDYRLVLAQKALDKKGIQ